MNTGTDDNLITGEMSDTEIQAMNTEALPEDWSLFSEDGCLKLRTNDKPFRVIYADFVQGKNEHRRNHGGGKTQGVSIACGLREGWLPEILDATAGLGADSWVLAGLGCRVTLFERNPIARLLLADGLRRARGSANEKLVEIASRLELRSGDFLSYTEHESHDVVYLDPMFPSRKKSAAVKKEMAAFHDLIGNDADSGDLLEVAMKAARYRVVVKRSKLAGYLGDVKPSYSLDGKRGRFDIYTKKSMKKK